MKHNTDLDGFQEKIGYKFKDIELLKLALTHSSYSNELKINKKGHNERIEFLGDAVLELVSSEFLFLTYKDVSEGKLTTLRASMVCEPSLAYCARDIKLDDYIMLGKGEENTGGRKRDSIISDAFEALIGAIYMDGGFTNAKEFIHKYVLNDLENKKLFYDSKTILQERMQAVGEIISYTTTEGDGPDHNKTFYSEVSNSKGVIGRGEGHNKKAAEQKAAYQALCSIEK